MLKKKNENDEKNEKLNKQVEEIRQQIINDPNHNALIQMLIDEITADGVINYKDVPNIILLY